MHHELAPEPAVETLTTRRMLRCGAVGTVMFILVFLVDGASRSGYDAARHPVSALSLGPRGWVQVTNFVVTGVLMVVFAVGLRRALRPGRASTWGPLLIAMFGVGLMASGTFPMDPMRGYPPGAPEGVPTEVSWNHNVHDAAGVLVFASLPAATFVFARRFASAAATRDWAIYSAATGVAMVAMFIAFSVAWESGNGAAGLIQRITILVGWTWTALLAMHVARNDRVGSHLDVAE